MSDGTEPDDLSMRQAIRACRDTLSDIIAAPLPRARDADALRAAAVDIQRLHFIALTPWGEVDDADRDFYINHGLVNLESRPAPLARVARWLDARANAIEETA